MGKRILNEALSKIVNAERRGKATAQLQPVSNMIASFLQVMKTRGYIKDFQVSDMQRVGKISVELQGRIKDCRTVMYRQDLKAKEIAEYKTRTLPTLGLYCDLNPKWCFGSRRGHETECGGSGSWIFSLIKYSLLLS
ncbi:hypothetical protein AQUCO_00900955v1 [Aquilegia coerulea]|uniref:30S ribosomal protein S8, chloroplastic n=1 Tax=Aquilegia coerulea TaxID=218851 RepID=A0A2G5EG49_AQUCA|nr:hypothetical protein AQUCO_00900955v1 [Aquilegia coerulea]